MVHVQNCLFMFQVETNKKLTETASQIRKAVQSDICHKWIHIACNNLNMYIYKKLQKDKSPWYCICYLQKELPYYSIGNVLNSLMHGKIILSPNPIFNSTLVSQNSRVMRKSLKRLTRNIIPHQNSTIHLMN